MKAAQIEMTPQELATRLGIAGTVEIVRARVGENEAGEPRVYLRCVGEGCPEVVPQQPPQTVTLDALRVPETAPKAAAPKAAKTN